MTPVADERFQLRLVRLGNRVRESEHACFRRVLLNLFRELENPRSDQRLKTMTKKQTEEFLRLGRLGMVLAMGAEPACRCGRSRWACCGLPVLTCRRWSGRDGVMMVAAARSYHHTLIFGRCLLFQRHYVKRLRDNAIQTTYRRSRLKGAIGCARTNRENGRRTCDSSWQRITLSE